MSNKTTTDWFTSWFDTSYYHTLYKDRNDEDAQLFMKNLTTFLQLDQHAHILDLPCGKGRHSLFLNSLGYKVTGTDLSKNSIDFAKKHTTDTLTFEVADMRNPLQKKYDAILNLFTSFGYFEDDNVDIQILRNIKKGLKKNGVAVIDFLNVEKVQQNLVKKEVKTVDGIDFYIQRKIENDFIIKEIFFFADNEQHFYTERVKFLDETKMKNYLQKAGLKITATFGDYQLNPFNSKTSNRLILIAK